jgi:opacity protein-like surface antigen
MTASAKDGFYVSGSVTATELGHNINRNTGQMDSPSISSFSSETDIGLRLGLGYKRHVSKDVFLAVEGFYSWENAQTESLNGMLRSTLDLEASYGADARIGYDVSDKFAVYGLAGVTFLDFDNDTGYTFAPPMQQLSETEAGFTYGFGAELQVTDRYSIIGEYRITNDVSFTPNPDVVGGFINDNQIDHNALRLGVNFSF